jgi:cadmium resistance protein CadD (predicted permease)
MSESLPTVITSIALFTSTNLDDIVILTLLFLASNASGRPGRWQIVTGQYVGIALLVTLSVVAAFGLTLVPKGGIGLLGLIPLGLGIRGLVQAAQKRKNNEKAPSITATSFVAIAGVTIANGGDNVAVYTPFFHSLNSVNLLTVIVIFAILIAIWCIAAAWLGRHKHLIRLIERFGHWIVPVVFILIGLIVLSSLI